MKYTYKTQGTCSTQIAFDLGEDGSLHNVKFTGGCSGNLKALGILLEGMQAKDAVIKLAGNTCGPRPTSCADQLATAVKRAVEES